MDNQVLTWLMFIASWFTLFFMKKEDLKRFMPVASFTAILSAIISDTGYTFGFWTLGEKIYPFSYLSPFLFGPLLVLTLWVFKLTYRAILAVSDYEYYLGYRLQLLVFRILFACQRHTLYECSPSPHIADHACPRSDSIRLSNVAGKDLCQSNRKEFLVWPTTGSQQAAFERSRR